MKKKQSTTPDKKITGQNETGQEFASEYVKLATEESDRMLSNLKEHLKESEDNPNNLLIIASSHGHFHITIVGGGYPLIRALAMTMYKNEMFFEIVSAAMAAFYDAKKRMQTREAK